MEKTTSTMAQQIAQAAIAFERRRSGRMPRQGDGSFDERHFGDHAARGLVAGGNRPSPRIRACAVQVEEFHQQLFANSSDELLAEIKRITGQEVREATAEIETSTGTVVKVFTTGTEVQVFRLAGRVPTDTWSGNGDGHASIERS